ncbi:hypothetical protein C8R30_10440 [Nitrosomonas nitrosa]|jgi:hypothetical protein|uniref:Uncharacterized protein n=1 Tax=Nitrosomonas nitrosa TaxID=52442 RepID=A0A1I4PR13_9PROT|nr:hypothetical protein C8R30_10440 [Nitrosomonas nitrosa]SFM29930.1 hypothetical protein SAMN05421880_11232 [Nitrosomonas nitrosa]
MFREKQAQNYPRCDDALFLASVILVLYPFIVFLPTLAFAQGMR